MAAVRRLTQPIDPSDDTSIMVVVRLVAASVSGSPAVQRVADDTADLPPFIDRDLLTPPVTTRDLPALQQLQGLAPPRPPGRFVDPSLEFHERERQRLERERIYLDYLRRSQRP